MKPHVRAALLTLLLLLGAASPAAWGQLALPPFESLVQDLTGTLTAEQQASLDEKLTAFQKRKGAQVALLILPSTEPEDIAQFGVRLAEAWKIGRAGVDDGAILIIAKNDHAMRIEVQYGLEGVLTDVTASRILNDTIAPLFKQGDYFGGVNAGLDQMLKVIDGEPLPPPDRSWNQREAPRLPWGGLLVLAFVFATFLGPMIGRALTAGALGMAGFAFGWWALGSVAMGLTIGVISLVIGLVGGFRSRGWGGGHVFREVGRLGGRGWRGGGGLGGGFGGGLGGRGGGGGASGRW